LLCYAVTPDLRILDSSCLQQVSGEAVKCDSKCQATGESCDSMWEVHCPNPPMNVCRHCDEDDGSEEECVDAFWGGCYYGPPANPDHDCGNKWDGTCIGDSCGNKVQNGSCGTVLQCTTG